MSVAGYISIPLRGRSLPASEQRTIIEALGEQAGLGAVSLWYSEPGPAGDNSFADRPVGAAALQELSQGDVLLVARMDCLGDRARTIRDALKSIHERGVRLVVADFFGQRFDSDDELSVAASAVLDGYVEYESSLRRKRASRAVADRRATGLRSSRFPPPGKRYVPIGTQANGRPLVAVEDDPDDRHWIEIACREYMRGKTDRQVLAMLHKADARTNLGRQWSHWRLRDIIDAQGGRRGMLKRFANGEPVVQ
jgi:DNA invertase Pin-like site-specific DNA recombinase